MNEMQNQVDERYFLSFSVTITIRSLLYDFVLTSPLFHALWHCVELAMSESGQVGKLHDIHELNQLCWPHITCIHIISHIYTHITPLSSLASNYAQYFHLSGSLY